MLGSPPASTVSQYTAHCHFRSPLGTRTVIEEVDQLRDGSGQCLPYRTVMSLDSTELMTEVI